MESWRHEGLKKKLKDIYSVQAGERIQTWLLYFLKVSENAHLHIGPNRIRSLFQKLVFKVKIHWDPGPRGGLEGHAPLDPSLFFYLKH